MRSTKITRAAGTLAALFLLFVITPEPYIIQLTFLGDVMLGRGISMAADRNQNWQPFEALFPVLSSADLISANLESPLTNAPITTSGYALCAPPGRSAALKDAKFNLLTLANNHNKDCGVIGLEDTRQSLHAAGLLSAGPEPQPIYIDLHGQRFAFLALDDVSAEIDLRQITPIVREAASLSNHVIISIHWGAEYQPAPSNRQRALADALVNNGADVIIGHHPHVIQPMESIGRGVDEPAALVFYSLGNALFDQHGLPDTRRGEMVSLYYSRNGLTRYDSQTFTLDPHKGVITALIP